MVREFDSSDFRVLFVVTNGKGKQISTSAEKNEFRHTKQTLEKFNF